MNPLSYPDLETFAVSDTELNGEIAQVQYMRDFVAINVDFSVSTGRRASGTPIVFIKSHTTGEMHAVVFADPDATP